MKKTAEDLAEELVNEVCEQKEWNDGNLYSVLYAIAEEAETMLNFPENKTPVFYSYEEFCEEVGIEVSKEDFLRFINETRDCIIGLIYEKLDEIPNPSYFNAMIRTIYFDIFPISLKGKYKICEKIHLMAANESCGDAENLCVEIAKCMDEGEALL